MLLKRLPILDSRIRLIKNGLLRLKVMDDINAPDYAFGLILAWARGASAEEYSFHPQGGLDRARNVTVLVKPIANATQLLPSVLSVSSPHGPPCECHGHQT